MKLHGRVAYSYSYSYSSALPGPHQATGSARQTHITQHTSGLRLDYTHSRSARIVTSSHSILPTSSAGEPAASAASAAGDPRLSHKSPNPHLPGRKVAQATMTRCCRKNTFTYFWKKRVRDLFRSPIYEPQIICGASTFCGDNAHFRSSIKHAF